MYDYLVDKLNNIADKPLLTFFGRSISKSELLRDIDGMAVYLHATYGIGTGDVVSIALPNMPQAVILFYATVKLGAIANMIHPLVPVEGLVTAVRDSGSTLVFLMDTAADKYSTRLQDNGITAVGCHADTFMPSALRSLLRVGRIGRTISYPEYPTVLPSGGSTAPTCHDEGRTAVYMHSGGTAGEPKTIALSAYAFNRLADNLMPIVDEGRDMEHDTALMILPMFHVFGLGVCLHTYLCMGYNNVLMISFNAKRAARLIRHYRITNMSGIPSMYSKLLHQKAFVGKHLSNMKFMFCGGDKLPEQVKKSMDETMIRYGSPARLQEGYGLTEATICCVADRTDAPGTVGRPLPDIGIMIIDSDCHPQAVGERGEIAICGPTIMQGYLDGDNSAFFRTPDGTQYVRTGDAGYMDECGRLYFSERLKRLVKISGINVFPSEIESVAYTVHGVTLCCAVQRTDADGKPEIELLVVADVGIDTDYLRDVLIATLSSRLMKYSVPRKITFVQSLPMTPLGKIDYRAL